MDFGSWNMAFSSLLGLNRVAMSLSSHVSENQVDGSLFETPLKEVLDACHKHLITGTLMVSANGKDGVIEIRAGAVDIASFDGADGRQAVKDMVALSDGTYTLCQKLPDLQGNLGESARFEGTLSEVSLVDLMRHCEDNALTCTITIDHGDENSEIQYRTGDLEKVIVRGEANDDALYELIKLDNGAFRVAAPPLDLGIAGWPSLGREPTAPFAILPVDAETKAKGDEKKSDEVPAKAEATEEKKEAKADKAVVSKPTAKKKSKSSNKKKKKKRVRSKKKARPDGQTTAQKDLGIKKERAPTPAPEKPKEPVREQVVEKPAEEIETRGTGVLPQPRPQQSPEPVSKGAVLGVLTAVGIGAVIVYFLLRLLVPM